MKNSLILMLLTLFSACGQLPPDKAKQIRDENDNNRTTPVVVSSMQFDSAASPDLAYLATYLPGSKSFLFSITRANQNTTTASVSLKSSDDPILYPALLGVFTGTRGLVSQSFCPNCTTSSALVVRNDGTQLQYRFPQLLDAGGVNLMPRLNDFILNHR